MQEPVAERRSRSASCGSKELTSRFAEIPAMAAEIDADATSPAEQECIICLQPPSQHGALHCASGHLVCSPCVDAYTASFSCELQSADLESLDDPKR